ncbi:LPXTG cell wall anchor domain-containing protein [Pseudomonas sp. A3.4]|nr:LPXTG cell wall anchor domain-containing protein [Atopomonas sediminilitoris]
MSEVTTGDSKIDALAAVGLILLVVATAIFWVSGQ